MGVSREFRGQEFRGQEFRGSFVDKFRGQSFVDKSFVDKSFVDKSFVVSWTDGTATLDELELPASFPSFQAHGSKQSHHSEIGQPHINFRLSLHEAAGRR